MSADFKEWKGTDLDFTVNYLPGEGERFIEKTAMLRWETATDKLRVLSVEGRE